MNRRQFAIAVASLSITSVAGCAEQPQNMNEETLSNVTVLSGGGKEVYRYIDHEAGIVLYADETANLGGLTAVPIEDTNL